MAATWSKIEVSKKPDVLVTCAGWSLKLDASVAWATALAQAFPRDPKYAEGGIGEAYAVTGPPQNGPSATAKIPAFNGVGDLAAALRPHLDGSDKRIYVVAHSSGTAYADFLFDKICQIFKAEKVKDLPKQVWYYNLDGGWDAGAVTHHPIFAHAFAASGSIKDKAGKSIVASLNHDGSQGLGAAYAKAKLGKFLEVDLSDRAAPTWPHLPGILHMALINAKNPLWLPGKQEHPKEQKAYFAGDINPTYLKCTKDNVTADYFAASFK